MPRRRRLLALAGSSLLAAAVARPAKAQARTVLSLAVVPQFPAAVLHRDWTPLLDQLTRRLGVDFKLLLQPTIPRFEAEVFLTPPSAGSILPE